MRVRATGATTWVAERGEVVIGRAVWWALPGETNPRELDVLTVAPSVPDRAAVGAALIAPAIEANAEVSCGLTLPPGWRDDPAVSREVAWRLDALARAGLGRVVERVRFAWTADAPLPDAPARLRLVDDVDAARAVFERITGDASAFDGYLTAALVRDGWRVGYAEGAPVGLTMPSTVDGGDVVAFIGVVPEHRGRGHARALLAHATRHLAGRGAAQVIGDTAADNARMAAAFGRAGYRVIAVRLVVSR